MKAEPIIEDIRSPEESEKRLNEDSAEESQSIDTKYVSPAESLTHPLIDTGLTPRVHQFLKQLDWDEEVLHASAISPAALDELLQLHDRLSSRIQRTIAFDKRWQKILLWLVLNKQGMYAPSLFDGAVEQNDEVSLLKDEDESYSLIRMHRVSELENKAIIPQKSLTCWQRTLWPKAQSLLLRSNRELQKLHAVQGYLQGHTFMYGKGYGSLYLSLVINQIHYLVKFPKEYPIPLHQILFPFLESALDSEQTKGCDTIQSQSKISCALANPMVISMILATPIVWGLFKGMIRWRQIKEMTPEKLIEMSAKLTAYRPHLWYDIPRWFFPRSQLQQALDWTVRGIIWDGRLSNQQRRELFDALIIFTRRAQYFSRTEALYVLASVADSISPGDFKPDSHQRPCNY